MGVTNTNLYQKIFHTFLAEHYGTRITAHLLRAFRCRRVFKNEKRSNHCKITKTVPQTEYRISYVVVKHISFLSGGVEFNEIICFDRSLAISGAKSE